jgi:hypothetical protein
MSHNIGGGSTEDVKALLRKQAGNSRANETKFDPHHNPKPDYAPASKEHPFPRPKGGNPKSTFHAGRE